MNVRANIVPALIVCGLMTGCGSSDTLDRIPPDVEVIEPEQDEIGAPISISVNATDNVGVVGVSLYVDGVFLERKTSPPYTFYWYSDFWGDGKEHLLSASALDPAGNIGTSKSVSVDVMKTSRPAVDVISPINRAVIGQQKITLKWKPIENTTSYTVRVSDSEAMDLFIVDEKTDKDFLTIELPEEKTYWWKVQPTTIGNIFGGWGKNHVLHRTGDFTSIIGSKKFDAFNSIITTRDAKLVLAGSSHALEKGGLLVKTSGDGKVEWERFFGGIDIAWLTSVVQTRDGGYLAGGQNTANGELPDQWLVKTDSSGFLQWSRTLLKSGNQRINSIAATSDGGYAVCGMTDTDTNAIDISVTKYDAAFEKIWERTFGGRYHDEAYQISATADGGLILAGVSQKGTGYASEHALALRLNVLGEEIWRHELRGDGGARYTSVVEGNGLYYLCGIIRSENNRQDALVSAVDSAGSLRWTKSFGNSHDDAATGIVIVNNQLAVCGNTAQDSLGIQDAWLLMLSVSGNELISRTFGGKHFDGAAGITSVRSAIALTGTTASFTSGSSDGFLIVVDADGNVRQIPP